MNCKHHAISTISLSGASRPWQCAILKAAAAEAAACAHDGLSSKGFVRLGARRVHATGAARTTSDAMGALLTRPEFVAQLAERDARPL